MKKILISLTTILMANVFATIAGKPEASANFDHSFNYQPNNFYKIKAKNQKLMDEVMITKVDNYQLAEVKISKEKAYNLQDGDLSSIHEYTIHLRYYDDKHSEISVFWWQLKLTNYINRKIEIYKNTLKDYATNDGLIIKISAFVKFDTVTFGDLGIFSYINYTPQKFDHNYDQVEKYYKFLAHDILKVGISTNAWNWISQQKIRFNLLNALFNNFPKYDKSGAGGYISPEDISNLAIAVFKNYNSVADYFQKSVSTGIKLSINTAGDFIGIEYQ